MEFELTVTDQRSTLEEGSRALLDLTGLTRDSLGGPAEESSFHPNKFRQNKKPKQSDVTNFNFSKN